jgi:hypothetical protein
LSVALLNRPVGWVSGVVPEATPLLDSANDEATKKQAYRGATPFLPCARPLFQADAQSE